jgi:UDP-N-acetylglucosamine diphosphorylase / glucose-1-phosphate thymidylyltransferase / UDP-N-acetylgalactosamine diphosphorylase / glucosamine-1-phosphate N-acetyltransferase / galactosamine-1-phosphate N-acetyltransferase
VTFAPFSSEFNTITQRQFAIISVTCSQGGFTLIDSAVVLAISASEHQSSLAENRPKSMLPALGKPLVVRVMERLYRAGIHRYYVVVGMNEGTVASYLSKQWKPDAKVEFIMRTNESFPALLAKTVQQIDGSFVIASYNSFSYERFLTSFLKENEDHPEHLILAGAQLNLSPGDETYYATLNEQQVTDIVTEKPAKDVRHLVLGEFAVCGTHFIEYLKKIDTTRTGILARNLFQIAKHYAASEGAQVMADETSWMLRVQSDKDLLTLNKRLLEDSNDSHILSELPYTVKVIPPVRIDPQVSVGQGVTIGPHVYVESGSSIGYGATIKNALILDRSNVPANAKIDNGIMTRRGIIKL